MKKILSLLLVAFVISITGCSEGPTEPEIETAMIRYEVSGTATHADIAWTGATGYTGWQNNTPLPWSYTCRADLPFYCEAQVAKSVGVDGNYQMRIYKDDVEVFASPVYTRTEMLFQDWIR
jgi:hypothetical protein